MGLRDDIQRAQTDALKMKESEKLSTLRMLWSAIRTEEINQRKELEDSDIVAVVSRQIKQLQDSLHDFRTANRTDLADKADKEIALLQTYLPKQLSDEELAAVVDRIVTDAKANGVADAGRVMGMVMKEVKGVADGNRVREMVAKRMGG
ncbi:MAG: GatB/YqeY domain-containing protein [Candidatus Paceibacterota bacterium]|jgi:hypothetical protein